MPLDPPSEVGAMVHFNGPVYEPEFDYVRLTGQIHRVYDLMRDGQWRTLAEIEAWTRDPAASISAQLRHLRKEKFGSHNVEKRPRGDRSNGLWEYRIAPGMSDPQTRTTTCKNCERLEAIVRLAAAAPCFNAEMLPGWICECVTCMARSVLKEEA